MGYQAVLRKLPSGILSESLEDVLTSSVFGAVSYSPPALTAEWYEAVTGATPMASKLRFEFWPRHRLADGSVIEPDVFVADELGKTAVVIEAKQRSDLRHRQLLDQGHAAQIAHPGFRLHLLTVSDNSTRPKAHAEVERIHPGLFATIRHASWADLYKLLDDWASQPNGDAGHRRLIEDALAVLRKFGRDPFRGLDGREVRAMERDVRWMYALPQELVKLRLELSRTLEGLRPPLLPLGNSVLTDIVGAVSINSPDRWLPRHFTLPFGATRTADDGRYFFVRASVNPPAIWVGYAPRRVDSQALLADVVGTNTLVARAGKTVRVVGVTSKGQPFEVRAGPTAISAAALRQMVDDPTVTRVNIIRAFPMALLSRPGADRQIDATLRGLIRLARSVPALNAP